MSVTRADLLTRLRHPAKSSAVGERTVLLTGQVCSDMREAADEIERLLALVKPAVEIRPNDDGSIDEIVARGCDLHIEQMSADGWFMGIEANDGSYWQFWFGAKNRKAHVEFRHTETVTAEQNHALSHPNRGEPA